MGKRQLFFNIVVLFIGILAIVLTLMFLDNRAIENNRQKVISRIQLITDLAATHYLKPVEQGGGGFTYENFQLPASVLMKNKADGVEIDFRAEMNRLIINARGTRTGLDGRRPVIVRGIVNVNVLNIQIRN